jgi:DNA repair protein RecO (recombination protein O)
VASYKTTGIVVRRFNLGEADRIITFLTNDHGKLKAVAKGVRRIKSRMAGHLEPFGEVELMLAEGRNLDVITSARLKRDATTIPENPAALAHAYLFAELIDRLIDEGVNQPELYAAAAEVFDGLCAGPPQYQLLELYFKLHLLGELGYKPELRHCVVCHASDPAAEYFFVSSIGGIADKSCTTDRRYPLTSSQIKFWRLVLGHTLPGVQRVPEAGSLAADTLPACDDFFEYHFGRRFAPLSL